MEKSSEHALPMEQRPANDEEANNDEEGTYAAIGEPAATDKEPEEQPNSPLKARELNFLGASAEQEAKEDIREEVQMPAASYKSPPGGSMRMGSPATAALQ